MVTNIICHIFKTVFNGRKYANTRVYRQTNTQMVADCICFICDAVFAKRKYSVDINRLRLQYFSFKQTFYFILERKMQSWPLISPILTNTRDTVTIRAISEHIVKREIALCYYHHLIILIIIEFVMKIQTFHKYQRSKKKVVLTAFKLSAPSKIMIIIIDANFRHVSQTLVLGCFSKFRL